ncbi:ComEC/Rec2 family competence protein [Ekhidna sp.]
MYFWNSYPFVRLTIVLILGIVCFDQFPFIWNTPIQILSTGILLLSISTLISHRYGFYKLRYLNGILAVAIVFYFGGTLTQFNYRAYSQNHYTNIQSKISGFSGTISSPVNERTNHFRYDFELDQVIASDSMINSSGKIHLYVRKDSATTLLKYGDHLIIAGSYYEIPGPDNPSEFNYKSYLERQGIYGHSFVRSDQLRITLNDPPNLFLNLAFNLRNSATQTIDQHIPSKRENGIAKALLLGIKDHLDNDVKKAYSSAGAMHVLAVSGLHVGIIYLLIQLLFGKLRKSGKWGKRLFGLISVLIIWFYATLTGLSPSVLRAATMFSLVAVSQATAREGNIYNTLGFAAFILLLFDPYLIYSVGFQLSFAAVIGIVYLQPKIYRLIDFRNFFLDKAWAITCVSIAAQLATFPLSAYYFHQFPSYFLVSNLIVIPSSFLMLVGGVFMLIIDPIVPIIGHIVGVVLHKFIWVLNEIISYVHILPNSLIEWIFMDKISLIFIYLCVISMISGLHFKSFKTIITSGIFGLLIISWNLLSNEKQSTENELVLYEISGKTVIDHIQGHDATLYVDDYKEEELELLDFQINPHRLSRHLRPIKETISTLRNQYFERKEAITSGQIAGKRIIIFDSTTFHLAFKNPIESDLIIINNGSVKSLKWLNENFPSKQVVIGNKNSVYYSNKMKVQAAELGLSIHSLKDDGALRINLAENMKEERTYMPAQLIK